MTILWTGAEDSDFISIIENARNTASNYHRAAYCRFSYWNNTTGAELLGNPITTPVSSIWLSAQFYKMSINPLSTPYAGLGLGNTSDNTFIGICNPTVSGRVSIMKWDGSSTKVRLAESSDAVFSANGLYKVDIQISNYGSNGTINVFVNGTLKVSYTGDLAYNSHTTLDQFVFRCQSVTYFANFVSELILADEDTRLMSLHTLTPNASGDTNDWTNDYDSIDEIITNDADVIHTDTVEDDFQCNLSDITDGDFEIKAVQGSVRVADAIGSKGIQIGIKTNSDIDLSSVQNLDNNVWKNKSNIWNVNPITSNPFTVAEINALQGMIRAKTAI